MKKGTDVIGKPVVTFMDGRQIEKVRDLVFDHKRNMVLGFLVDEGGWFSDARVLPLELIKSIGEDAVVVETETAIASAENREDMSDVLQSDNILKGTKLMTESGKNIGTLVDLYFDEISGRVEGYEVSGGVFADMYNGRSMVPASSTLRLGQDVAFVSDDTIDLLEQQVGGLKGAAQNAGAKVQDAAQTAGEKVKDATQAVGEKASDLKDQANTSLHSEETQDRVEQTKATVHEKASDLKEGAANLWETVKTKTVEYKDKATHEVEEARIRRAVGHPANRVVLDREDNVLLNVGDIITHEAVEKARSGGVLEILLGSVYDKDPELTTEDMKAKTAGTATLPQKS